MTPNPSPSPEDLDAVMRAVYDEQPWTVISEAMAKATGLPLRAVIPYDLFKSTGGDDSPLRRTVAVAIAAWNTRTLSPQTLPAPGEVELRETIADLEGQLEEALYQPWPKWAEDMKKQIRAVSGYDGYDDASDGVNLPDELSELINELTEQADKNLAEARASRKLDELERSVEHYRVGMNEWIATAQAAQAALATVAAANDEGVAELRDMEARATRGEWSVAEGSVEDGSIYIDADDTGDRPVAMIMSGSPHNQDRADAAFIVAAVAFTRAAIRLLPQGGGK